MALVEPSLFLAELQDVPDVRDVQVGVREVRVLPIHPLAHPDGVFGDGARGSVDAGSAGVRDLSDPVRLVVALAFQNQLTLHVHIDPQALPVEDELVYLVASSYRIVPLLNLPVGTIRV